MTDLIQRLHERVEVLVQRGQGETVEGELLRESLAELARLQAEYTETPKGYAELVKARNGVRDAIVTLRGGHSAATDDADKALAALDIAIGLSQFRSTTPFSRPTTDTATSVPAVATPVEEGKADPSRIAFLEQELVRLQAERDEAQGKLSLSIQRDPLAISELLDDSTRERELYHGLIAAIRRELGEDGLHAQLLNIPTVISAKLRAAEAARNEAQNLAEVRLEMFQREHEQLQRALARLLHRRGLPALHSQREECHRVAHVVVADPHDEEDGRVVGNNLMTDAERLAHLEQQLQEAQRSTVALRAKLTALVAMWRAHADNTGKDAMSEGASIERICANELDAILRKIGELAAGTETP